MKNKIQIMFVRGLQKALNHDNGPRLPRHWKVIASTLLLLFTFAIGNVWAAVPADTYYSFTEAKSANAEIAPTSGVSTNKIKCGSSGSVASSSATFANTSYSYGLKLGNSAAKGCTIGVSATTTNPAHIIIFCSGSGKDIYLYDGSTRLATGYTYSAPSVVDLTTTKTGSLTLYASGDVYCYYVQVLYEGNNNIFTDVLSEEELTLPATLTAASKELCFFRPCEVPITDGKFTWGSNTSSMRRTVSFKAHVTGTLTVGIKNVNNSGGRTASVYQMTDYKTLGESALKTTSSLAKNATDELEVSVTKGTYYAITGSNAGVQITSLTLAPDAEKHHVTYSLGGDYGTTPTQADVAEGAKFNLHNGTTGITPPTGKQFGGWNDGTTTYAGGAEYTMGTLDVTLTAVWENAKTDPTATFSAGAYVVGAAALDLSGLWSSNSDGAVTYALKEASDDAEVSGSSFTATKAGSYVVTASQAATSTYNAIEKEATITVTWPATGAATITYNLDVTNSGTTLQTLSTTNATSSSISVAASTSLLYGGLTKSSSKGSHNGTRTLGINTLAEETADKYFGVTFTVADDYMFTPSAISLKVLTIGGNATSYKAVLTDGTNSIVGTVDATNDSEKTLGSWSGLGTTNLSGTVTLKLYAWYTTSGSFNAYRLSTPITISGTVAVAPTTYDLTFAAGTGASGSMSTLKYAEGVEVTLPACTFTPPTGKEFDEWVVTKTAGGASVTVTNNKFTMPAEAVTATATWKDEVVKYAITEGTPENGSVDADVAEAAAGETVTLTATPDEDYVFSAWNVYKTGESSTKVSVTNNTFTMPAYAVTVNATFAADPRAKVLYVTSNSESDTKSDDKLYAALKDTYNVKIVGPASDADQSGYALIVLHESIDGKNDYNKTAVATAKTGSIPVLNTKSYFYPSGRWNWGTPNAGTSVKGATMNSAYCNIADHPLFNDVTVSEGFIEITDDAADKCMQPVGSFTSGYEGYTLATTPNAESGNGCAIHEIPAGTTARGVSSGKYLMISVSNAKLDALNANGQKLFQNAAAYLIDGSANWTPIVVPTAAAITADPNAAYFVGDNIALTASATGTSAATTYTWYKGDNLADAKEAGALKATATAAAGGNNYGVTGCALADAGTYWCVISNGTDCEAAASLAVTVSDVSYDIAFVSAHGTAPSATTGVSYTLPELSADGWAHQGWTANINVTVDDETVTAGTTIANGKLAVFGADVTFTAVWVQVFDVTFNMQSHGAAVAAQHILDGGKATEPNDPSAIGWVFGGWFTDAECTAGNEFDFNTAISDDTELFAKWTAFAGCVELWPATSGDAPAAVGDAIVMQSGSNGAAMTALAKPDKLSYTGSGLQFASESGVKVKVVLNNDMTVGTKISLTLVANGTGTRGLNLYTKTGSKINAFTCWVNEVNPATNGAEETFTYTVVAEDGLDGTNEFQLWRNNTVCLKSLKVESCGAAVIYHDLTSAVDPTGKGTVTLGASSVREGLTTTATYSAIDEAYEFDEWQISGTGASIADASANPAVITMGTADAVVTLKLKAATPKHTVTYDVKGHGVAPASEDVKEGAKVTKPADPTAENWAFIGWYKETTLENEWNFDVDVMGEENITLYAKWEDESGAIKLFDGEGNLNTTKFVSPAKTTIEINEVEYTCLAQFSSNRTSLGGATPSDMVQYNATTDAAKIKMTFYNNNSGVKKAILYKYEEGAESPEKIEIEVPGQTIYTTDYYTFNSSKNRSFYVCMNDRSNIRVLQVKVMDNGTAIQQAGQAGYAVTFNKGRMYAKDGVAASFEGMTINASSEYKVYNNSNLATKSYIQFTTTVNGMILRVTRAGGNYYVSQDPSEMGTTYSKNEDITLATAGTWYIGSTSPSSSASFTKIEFIAPKCEAPAFNALANSDICSGDPYVALDGTGTVSDGGSITYKWYAEGDAETVLATTATYTPSADGNYYVVALHHVDGYTDNEVTSDVVTVKTHAGTAISEPLADQRGNVDDVVALEVAASGKNLHYAWKECATIDGEYTAVAGAADAASLNVTITEGMDKYYKVIVSSDCGDAQESVAHVTQYVPVAQANVTGSIAWDWTKAASVNEIKLTSSTAPKKNEGFVMANGKATVYNNANFESDKLYLEGEYIVREGKYFQGQTIKFNTTVAGAVRVKFSHTGNATEDKPARELYINGVATGEIRDNATAAWSDYIEVPAGEVSITAYYVDPVAKPGQQYIRVPEIEFLTIAHQRTSGYKAGDLGTVCLEDAAVINGAKLYELGGLDGNGYLAFDEIQSGKLEAGKPYLFEVTNPSLISFYKQVNAAHADAEIETNGMIGTFSEISLEQDVTENLYYFSGRHIWRVNDFTVSIPIPAHRCYVDMDDVELAQAPAPGRRRVTLGINGNNAPTDVENVQSDEVQCTKVMINGQLFILRGEKMFDATGKLVK